MPAPSRLLFYFAALLPLAAADSTPSEFPVWRHGDLSIKPSGFFDVIGMSRSATTADSILTHFGSIPLTDSSGESVASVAHSRLMLKSEYKFADGRDQFSTYLEADFLNSQAGGAPWHWRQYWASWKLGTWEILGGQGWSLLRENRAGINTEKDLMNTDVIDPAYHVGIAGARHKQVRLARHFGRQSAAAAWQNNGDFEGKWALDGAAGHIEAAGVSGHRGRRAVQVSAVARLTGGLRLISQQYLARRALNEALSLVANGVDGGATLEGLEWQAAKRLEWYSYAGLVRSHHSAGNRLVRECTTGFNWRTPATALRGVITLSLQYSYVDRSVWDGRTGAMHFVMYRMRFTMP